MFSFDRVKTAADSQLKANVHVCSVVCAPNPQVNSGDCSYLLITPHLQLNKRGILLCGLAGWDTNTTLFKPQKGSKQIGRSVSKSWRWE